MFIGMTVAAELTVRQKPQTFGKHIRIWPVQAPSLVDQILFGQKQWHLKTIKNVV
jgi:hypothetical protein